MIGAGGCLGPTTAVTLTSDPDKALANSEAAKKRVHDYISEPLDEKPIVILPAEVGGTLVLVGLR